MTSLRAIAVAVLGLCACGPGRGSGGSTADLGGVASTDGPSFVGCGTAEYQATQPPAALLVVLDRSSSMANDNKWFQATQAVTKALDENAFDDLTLGLYAAPTAKTIMGPACIFGLPVACEAPAAPQIALASSGTAKSAAASGVRHDIKAWLAANPPTSGIGDASPLYAAVQAATVALKALPLDGKRILFIVTDGTISCNEFSSRPGFADCNGCSHDWEDPSNLVSLLGQNHADAQRPIDTFLVGVPGADTYDSSGCNFPPYHMRLALSAMAYAGSPDSVPAACNGKTFTKGGADPGSSCHFDMTQGTEHGFDPLAGRRHHRQPVSPSTGLVDALDGLR